MRIIEVIAKPGFVLAIKFDDGTYGDVSIKEKLYGPVFEPLLDPDYFAKVSIDEFGAIFWPNGADLAPDKLYSAIKSN